MIFRWMRTSAITAILALVWTAAASAELTLPALFTDHMVLQRDQPISIWGKAEAGAEVTVTLGDQTATATADDNGRWKVQLEPLPAGGPHDVSIKSGDSEKKINDVLVGEVWVCSGQSNMQWPIDASNDPDLEKLTAKFPQIRLITVPQVGTQEPQDDFNGKWEICSPETVGQFSAVGYLFGRQLHQTLDVPVGLIDNAWGGSSAEAWVRRDLLEKDDIFNELMARWEQTESTYDHEKAQAQYQENLEAWQKKAEQAKAEGKPQPAGRPSPPRNPLTGQHRPANLYNGVLKPVIGYGIRGVIWYQGESNAGRAYQYRELFPLMIENWRDEWGQGDFPFYWVQLADFLQESPEPKDSAWAELREAQTMTLDRLTNTGQAVIIDLGEAEDIHPKNKQDVAKRLARIALARDYGYDIVHQSPRFKSLEIDGEAAVVTLDTFGSQLDTFDTRAVQGFTIAGEDKKFYPAKAELVGADKVRVTSDQVKNPVAVRYAWADNPVCNLQNVAGLPATPFRSDDWEGVTANSR